MKPLLTTMLIVLTITFPSVSQDKQDEHYLDGTSMDYYYQNGSAVQVSFNDGQFNYKWIAGPNEGAQGKAPYRSRKIGDKMYFVNFRLESSSTFVTFVFNFNQNVMYSSAILMPKTDQEAILFEGGIIEHLTLKEK